MSDYVAVKIPKISMSAEEVLFVEWLVEDGVPIGEGDVIYSVETDKVGTEVEAATSGVLRHGTAVGEETYAVGTEIGRIERAA
ncbi:biotin/lipoyl-containing protein [Arthrobacter sp. zg-Y820]|uniref:biotin/lipoyl-containing protein n=1 Tax=unclassified Arthrobacter TaxID=235627 RepID=UPI00253F66B8|nr:MULTISPECIES: biotin/lipoyl-containing protein [unclassified Arthrobacter]MCC9197688.1 hypothetical protein [Arthrobacter sp. zg-Y820]MDK1280555.1 biotin/lipoyl-containing protein [Arthrobacter sp. zg.Y820]WIB10807.1 biotin/lipoyl-containing protein [Arthrobacter sp. zg-Y820]